MSIVLLRTLTRKSIIGFGWYRDMSVQNLLDLAKHKELLNIYYTCRNIDFNQDLKEELCISGERDIDKKNPSEKRYIKDGLRFQSICLKEIMNKMTEEQLAINTKVKLGSKQMDKKMKNRKTDMYSSLFNSKGRLKAVNHGHHRKK